MRYLKWISLLTALCLMMAMLPVVLAEEDVVSMPVDEFVSEANAIEADGLFAETEADLTEEAIPIEPMDYGTEVIPVQDESYAVSANENSDFEIDENGVLTKYNGFDNNVTIPNGVIEIGHSAFSFDVNLKSVVIPSSVNKIGSNAFHNCSALESIIIPDSVTEIEEQAFSSSGLRSITLPDSMSLSYE